jgi:hypothetical protein
MSLRFINYEALLGYMTTLFQLNMLEPMELYGFTIVTVRV